MRPNHGHATKSGELGPAEDWNTTSSTRLNLIWGNASGGSHAQSHPCARCTARSHARAWRRAGTTTTRPSPCSPRRSPCPTQTCGCVHRRHLSRSRSSRWATPARWWPRPCARGDPLADVPSTASTRRSSSGDATGDVHARRVERASASVPDEFRLEAEHRVSPAWTTGTCVSTTGSTPSPAPSRSLDDLSPIRRTRVRLVAPEPRTPTGTGVPAGDDRRRGRGMGAVGPTSEPYDVGSRRAGEDAYNGEFVAGAAPARWW